VDFWCEFDGDVHFVIRVTIYGIQDKEGSQVNVKAMIHDWEVSQVNIKAKIQDKEVSQDSVKAKIQDKEVLQGEPSTLQLGTPLICHNYYVLSSYTTCYGIP